MSRCSEEDLCGGCKYYRAVLIDSGPGYSYYGSECKYSGTPEYNEEEEEYQCEDYEYDDDDPYDDGPEYDKYAGRDDDE